MAQRSRVVSLARAAAASAALEWVEPGMEIGLGSGRAVWELIEDIRLRWPDGVPLRAVTASDRTQELAAEAGIEVEELDGRTRLDVAFDGADEIDGALGLLKGGGGALLREKIVVSAAERFVVIAETRKRVDVLGVAFPLPVEVVRFGWGETRQRVLEHVETADLRSARDRPFVTDEGHFILDCRLPENGDRAEIGALLKSLVGVVEHGLFLDMADVVLLGRDDGEVEALSREAR